VIGKGDRPKENEPSFPLPFPSPPWRRYGLEEMKAGPKCRRSFHVHDSEGSKIAGEDGHRRRPSPSSFMLQAMGIPLADLKKGNSATEIRRGSKVPLLFSPFAQLGWLLEIVGRDVRTVYD